MSQIVVRVRSDVGVERSIKETLNMLNLTKVNHAVIIPDNPQYAGMLQKAKDYITWGDATAEMVESMLRERGRLIGDKPLTDDVVASESEHKNIATLAKAIASDVSPETRITGMLVSP